MQTDSPTKTAASEREIKLGESIMAVLVNIQVTGGGLRHLRRDDREALWSHVFSGRKPEPLPEPYLKRAMLKRDK